MKSHCLNFAGARASRPQPDDKERAGEARALPTGQIWTLPDEVMKQKR
jgi:hypothetical protein